MSARRGLGLALSLSLSLAGCGVPEDEEPRVISAAEAPIDLGTDTSSTVTAAEPGTSRARLWFVDADGAQLTDVLRPVQGEGLGAAVRGLLGVGTDDLPLGVRSAIPEGTRVNDVRVDGSTAIVDLAAGEPGTGIFGIQSTEQLRAFAQLVFTAVSFSGISGVLILQDGQTFAVPTDTGTSDAPLGRSDYATLDPDAGT